MGWLVRTVGLGRAVLRCGMGHAVRLRGRLLVVRGVPTHAVMKRAWGEQFNETHLKRISHRYHEQHQDGGKDFSKAMLVAMGIKS